MKSSDYIAEFLYLNGIDCCFELVGGMITHILDSISKTKKIKIISCHHEQASGFAAEGYGRITGKPGIALATSGPGATNLITAIGSCYFDSTPALFICGQVNTHELSTGKNIRQLGFQETDIVNLTKSITKESIQLKKAEDLPEILPYLFELSLSKRQGPCLLDIPMNLQSADVKEEKINYFCNKDNLDFVYDNSLIKNKVNLLIKDIKNAERPLLLLGGGCSAKKNRNTTLKLIELLKFPAVCSLLGIDCISSDNNFKVGFIGSYGNRWANKILSECDLLIAIGTRLDIRQTGSNTESFRKNKKIWQIDIDNYELENDRIAYKNCIQLEIKDFYNKLKHLYRSKSDFKLEKNLRNWIYKIQSYKDSYPLFKEYKARGNEVNPIEFINLFSTLNKNPTIYIADVGQHQMWSAQSLYLKHHDRFLTSGGMGAMGFGLPAGIGASFGDKEKKIVLICGDGGFQLNIQELETIKRNNINITILLINNRCHGMVRQFQESYFNKNYQSTIEGYSAPDFVAVAKAYGIQSFSIKEKKYSRILVNDLLKINGPCLLEIFISSQSNVYPKLAFGRNFGEMEPDISPISMEST